MDREEPVIVSSSVFALRSDLFALHSVLATISQGYGVASGKSSDSRFPDGTLTLQLPHFEKRGLDLRPYYRGTLNLTLRHDSFLLGEPDYRFDLIKWSPLVPPENFSFYSCRVLWINKSVDALVYWPHPSTKPEFHQESNVLEILAPAIDGITYGDQVYLEAEPHTLSFHPI